MQTSARPSAPRSRIISSSNRRSPRWKLITRSATCCGCAPSLAKWQATVRSEKAASMAIEVHGANGYSNDYPVERYLRNCKAAIIYEGTRDIHTLMQADWALGLKKEKAARKTLPPWK